MTKCWFLDLKTKVMYLCKQNIMCFLQIYIIPFKWINTTLSFVILRYSMHYKKSKLETQSNIIHCNRTVNTFTESNTISAHEV